MWVFVVWFIKVLYYQMWGLLVIMVELESDGFYLDGMCFDLDGYSVIVVEWKYEFDFGLFEWVFEDISGMIVDFDIQLCYIEVDYEL